MAWGLASLVSRVLLFCAPASSVVTSLIASSRAINVCLSFSREHDRVHTAGLTTSRCHVPGSRLTFRFTRFTVLNGHPTLFWLCLRNRSQETSRQQEQARSYARHAHGQRPWLWLSLHPTFVAQSPPLVPMAALPILTRLIRLPVIEYRSSSHFCILPPSCHLVIS